MAKKMDNEISFEEKIVGLLKKSNARMKKIMDGEYDRERITAEQKEFELQLKALDLFFKKKKQFKGIEKQKSVYDGMTAEEIKDRMTFGKIEP